LFTWSIFFGSFFALGATFILGLIALVRCSIKVSPRRTVEGTPARVIGIILLGSISPAVLISFLVWPACVVVAVIIGAATAKKKPRTTQSEMQSGSSMPSSDAVTAQNMSPVKCINCDADISLEEARAGWCETCGKKLPHSRTRIG